MDMYIKSGVKDFSIGHMPSHHPQDYHISILSSAHRDIVLQRCHVQERHFI